MTLLSVSSLLSQSFTTSEREYIEKRWSEIDNLIPASAKSNSLDWSRFRKKAVHELEEKVLYARSIKKSPFQIDIEEAEYKNKLLAKEHEILTNGYSLNEDDYQLDIYPNLCRFSFFPIHKTVGWNGESISNLVYLLSSPVYTISSEAKDQLLGICDIYAVSNIVKTFRKNYERLQMARMAGHASISAYENPKSCDSCKVKGNLELSIIELLEAFRDQSISFPHEIPWSDEIMYCIGPNLTTVTKGIFIENQ